jgi:predicted nucleic-acid-binding Zn-ribbon protein
MKILFPSLVLSLLLGTISTQNVDIRWAISPTAHHDKLEMIESDEFLSNKAPQPLQQSDDNVFTVNLNIHQAGIFTVGTNLKKVFDLRASINTDFIVVVGADCVVNCDRTAPYKKSESTSIDELAAGANIVLPVINVYEYTSYPNLTGDVIIDRICIKDFPKCTPEGKAYPQTPFLYLRGYNNPMKPTQRFD